MSLFARFFLVLLPLALGPVAACGVWFLRSSARMQDNARSLHEQLARLTADSVEESVARFNLALAFAPDLDYAARGEDWRAHALKLLQHVSVTQPRFSLLAVLDASGRETVRIADTAVFPESEYADRSGEEIVARSQGSGRIAASPVFARGGRPLVAVAHPLADGRILYAAWDFSDLFKRVNSLRAGSSGRILLLDPAGRPLPGLAEGLPELRWENPPSGKSGWLESVATSAGTMVGAYAATPSLGWIILSLQPRTEAFAVGKRFAMAAFAYLAALGTAALAAAYWLARRLTAPLTTLVEGARRAAREDFDTPVPELGWGELNLLSRALNEMTGRLKAFRDLHMERILEEKAKVDALVHTIPDGIVLASLDGKLLYVNASARSLLNPDIIDTIPKQHTVHEAFREPRLRDLTYALMRGRKRSAHMELELQTGGTRRGVFLCRAVTVEIASRPVGILVLLRDVTGEREIERMKEEFFHSIVHDLRGPLGTIDGFVQIMSERGFINEKQKMYVGYVQASTERLRRLVTDILDTAKIDSGQIRLKPEPLELRGFCERLRSLYALQAQTQGIELTVERGPDPASPLRCDRELTERVAMNLLGNALKFTPKGGRITLAAAAVPGAQEVEISVADTGPGIPPDKLDVVFEKFKQLEAGIQKRSGYGLGLSICKKVVELHGGRIWAESGPSRGSRFVFRLPLQPGRVQAASASPGA